MIELTNLQKVVDQRTVVDIPTLEVAAGEIAALVGPAGSGKGELLSLLTGKTRPTLGQVRLAGLDPCIERETFSRQVGVLFEEDSLYARLSALDNLAFHCQLYNLPRQRAAEVLRRVGLGDHARVRTEKLGSGMARRLAFGRAILHDPQVLLLIEPFARCDESSITLLSDLMRELADGGKSLLIFAGDEAYLPSLCDTIHTLEKGALVSSYKPQEEQPRAGTPFKVPARLEGKVALVNPGDILYADVQDGRAYLQTAEGRLPTHFTLTELEERLARSGFFRAHRAYLVNLQHVKEVIPYTRDSFSLRLDDGANTEIPLSKNAAGELKELLGY
jgi:ABC-2 type transport system ATP-binding protein